MSNVRMSATTEDGDEKNLATSWKNVKDNFSERASWYMILPCGIEV